MKAFLLGGAVSCGLTLAIYAQSPTISPETPVASPSPALAASPLPTASARPAASLSPANEFADKIKQKVDRKLKHKGFDITIDGGDEDEHETVHGNGDIPRSVVPIVVVTMLAVFGFPVAIVAVIMASSWAKSRSLHRTVRMMVEKGQPVPPELFAAPGATGVRPWYDLRRGIVLLGVGVGVVMFFGIAAGWDEGVWALGLIPALIGLGYILAWRLANRHGNGFKQ